MSVIVVSNNVNVYIVHDEELYSFMHLMFYLTSEAMFVANKEFTLFQFVMTKIFNDFNGYNKVKYENVKKDLSFEIKSD